MPSARARCCSTTLPGSLTKMKGTRTPSLSTRTRVHSAKPSSPASPRSTAVITRSGTPCSRWVSASLKVVAMAT